MDIENLKTDVLADVNAAGDMVALDALRVAELGKKGRITAQMKQLGGLPPADRAEAGKALNMLKGDIAKAISARMEEFKKAALEERLKSETLDVTLPVAASNVGKIHPISQTVDELLVIFADLGFELREGPEIEDDFHNFTSLNIPETHPARQMQDTFYMPAAKEGEAPRVLRTHTSPVQIRTMMAEKPPVRIIAPGRVYRSDYDLTHTPMFHQIEGLVIDEKSNMGHLKGVLLEMFRRFFQLDDLPLRFRPSHFPFTEPSAEMDLGCGWDNGVLKLGDHGSWLELGGCGMVHPNVLKHCGLDTDKYQGYAFGLGIERIAMLKYGTPDLRAYFDADIRWLKHYGFVPLDMPNLATKA